MAESHRGKPLCLALTVFVVMPVRATLLEASLPRGRLMLFSPVR